VTKLRKAESAQHSVQWTGGYAPRFQAFFSALGFSGSTASLSPPTCH